MSFMSFKVFSPDGIWRVRPISIFSRPSDWSDGKRRFPNTIWRVELNNKIDLKII